MPDALTVIHARKSVRRYRDRPVPQESLEILLRTGMAGPSAGNKRPWAFVVTREKAGLAMLAQGMPYGKMLTSAAAAITVCGLMQQTLPDEERDFWIQDCSAASQNILLAAEALGLGAVWLGVYPLPDRVEHARRVLGLPRDVTPLNVLAIGYPLGAEKARDKFNPAAIHWEKW